MKVSANATKEARKRHADGVKRLDKLFGFAPAGAPLNAHTGRALATKADRRTWREWRDATFPARVKRRRRRKLANATKRRARRAAR